jgi:predicted nucleic acid-binding protein
MAYAVVLDANVLYPFSLRDLLLRLAEQELFDVVWSDRILEEMARSLIEDHQVTEVQAARLTEAMHRAFPDAAQDLDAIAVIEPTMRNHEGDRHVLAAAVVAGGEAVERTLQELSDALRKPPRSVAGVLDLLQLGGATTFVRRMRERFSLDPRTDEEILGQR